jgi:hypothetical protein
MLILSVTTMLFRYLGLTHIAIKNLTHWFFVLCASKTAFVIFQSMS